jgi:YVTN family beta-propeller protein
MQNNNEIQSIPFIIIIVTNVWIILFSADVYSQEEQDLHEKTLYEIIKHSTSNSYPHIDVGKFPIAIAINHNTNTIYVANADDNTVSIINGTTNTKIGENILVGNTPYDIAINHNTNTIYVANADDNTVSVIDGKNNTKMEKDIHVGDNPSAIAINPHTSMVYVINAGNNTVSVIDEIHKKKIGGNIPVGDNPSAIAINPIANTIYVANADDNTVSVIDGKNNTKMEKDIPVGDNPSAIAINQNTRTVYIAKSGDDSLSIIDDTAKKVVTQVMFNVEPFNSGHIECDIDKLIAPLSKQFYLYDGDKCIAKPNSGFEFVSWQKNLKGNSTQMLNVAPAPSILDSILDIFHMKPNKSEATLAITKFGSFTANFKSLPPPVPAEYVATLFSVVVTAFVGTWLTPTVIAWRKSKNQGKKLGYYHNEVKSLYADGRLNKKDINKLDFLRNNITDEYTKGKINKEQFNKLVDETSIKYREIFKNELNSLDISENEKEKQLTYLTDKINDIYNNGKINKEQFDELREGISLRYREIFKNKIDSLDNLSEYDKENKLTKIEKDIEDAYASRKINEMHHNLLQNKLSKYAK